MAKDSNKYAATGGWGYAQFNKDGKPAAKQQESFEGRGSPVSIPGRNSSGLTRLV
jgi:hypothetical protein